MLRVLYEKSLRTPDDVQRQYGNRKYILLNYGDIQDPSGFCIASVSRMIPILRYAGRPMKSRTAVRRACFPGAIITEVHSVHTIRGQGDSLLSRYPHNAAFFAEAVTQVKSLDSRFDLALPSVFGLFYTASAFALLQFIGSGSSGRLFTLRQSLELSIARGGFSLVNSNLSVSWLISYHFLFAVQYIASLQDFICLTCLLLQYACIR